MPDPVSSSQGRADAGPHPDLVVSRTEIATHRTVKALRSAAEAVRRGRRDISDGDIDRALDTARELAQTLEPEDRAPLAGAMRELRAAARERHEQRVWARGGRPAGGRRQRSGPPPTRHVRNLAREALDRARSDGPKDPDRLIRKVAGGLFRHDRIERTVSSLAQIKPEALRSMLRREGIPADHVDRAADTIAKRASEHIHGRVLERARDAIGAVAERLEQAASGPALERLHQALHTAEAQRLLTAMEGAGADMDEVRELHDAYETTPGPARRRIDEQLREALGRVVGDAARGFRGLHQQLGEGRFANDGKGEAYLQFPKLVKDVAKEMRIGAHVADGTSHGHSVLEDGIAAQVREAKARETRAEWMMFATGVVVTVLTGGSAAAALAGTAVMGTVGAASNAAAFEDAAQREMGVGAGTNTAGEAREARTRAEIETAGTVANTAMGGVVGTGGPASGSVVVQHADDALVSIAASNVTYDAVEEAKEELER